MRKVNQKNMDVCPRCGLKSLDRKQSHNSMSRHEEGVYICAACGTDEAMRDYIGNVMQKSQWADSQHGN